MAVNLIRKNSDTPNIRNYDDARLFRYINQGKSGIIKDYGDELEITQGANNVVHIASGEIVHQGWQVEITAAGFDIQLEGRDTREYYTIYLEINLSIASQQKAEIKYLKGNEAYPTIDTGDDLTTTPTGTSRLLVAQVLLQNGVITITPKLAVIPYYPTYALESTYAEYASRDTSKGTIEQRLNDLGFKQGSLSITLNGGGTVSSPTNSLVKQGQMVRCQLSSTITGGQNTYTVYINVPTGFRPIVMQKVIIAIKCNISLRVDATDIETTITEVIPYENITVFIEKFINIDGTISFNANDVNTALSALNKYYGGVQTTFRYSVLTAIQLYAGWKLN